jgi:glutamate-ammonia-ligase adenylyltransferase
MTRIAWRDLTGRALLAETTRDLSHLAETCLEHALMISERHQSNRLGTPMLGEGESPNA